MRMGGLGLKNLSDSADKVYSASIRVSALLKLVSKIEAQSHGAPEEAKYDDWYTPPGKKRMMG